MLPDSTHQFAEEVRQLIENRVQEFAGSNATSGRRDKRCGTETYLSFEEFTNKRSKTTQFLKTQKSVSGTQQG